MLDAARPDDLVGRGYWMLDAGYGMLDAGCWILGQRMQDHCSQLRNKLSQPKN